MCTSPQKLHEQLIRNMKPAMRYTEGNPAQWQTAARSRLKALLAMPEKNTNDDLIIEYTQEAEDYTEIRFTFAAEAGYRPVAHLLIPRNVDKPIPMICLQGHSTGMHVSLGRPKYEEDQEDIDGGRDFAVQAIRNG